MLVPRSTLACPNWFTHPATIPTSQRHGDIRVVQNTCLELIARVIHNHGHHISLARAFTLQMTISDSKSNSKFCSPARLICILGKPVTLSKQTITSGTASDGQLSLGSTIHKLRFVVEFRSSKPWCDPMHKQRSRFYVRASLQTEAFLTN